VTETRKIDPLTGGAKGQKLARLGAIDPLARWALAEVAGYGADKYAERFNYLRGYDWSLTIDAAHRHLMQIELGEDYDLESGMPHGAHLAWHGLCVTSFLLRGIGNDDRAKYEPI
jgi:hypothetical protein